MNRGLEFSHRPLIAGSFVGIRSWRVADGALTGVWVQSVWREGVNDASCAAGFAAMAFADAMARMSAASVDVGWAIGKAVAAMNGRVYPRKRPKPVPPPVRPEPKPHPVGGLGCVCGFYAYFDLGHNPHHHPGNVLGLVEGYGTMTIGQRGFRASKARIVALIEPVPSSVRGTYPSVPIFSTVAAALAEFPLSTPPADERPPKPADTRSVADRALDARRNRNTGPADRRGLDGHHRKAS